MAKINWSALGNKQKKETEKKDTSYLFKLTKDEHQLRIVPFPLNSKVFDSEYFTEENNLFVELSVHNRNMIPYAEDKMTLVIDSIGEVDPITKFSKQLHYDNKFGETSESKAKLEVAKNMLPDRFTYCCVIDREDETPTPYLWRIPLFKDVVPLFARASSKLKKKLKIDEDDDDFYEFDINEGFDITVESTVKKSNIEGRNAEYRAVSSIIFDTDATPVAETKEELKEIYSKMVNPFKLYHIKTASQLQAILDKAMNGDDEDEGEGEEIQTKAKAKPVVKKRTLPEDDDDLDEQDEAPKTKQPVTKEKNFDALFKKGGKKALEDDDDDVPY